MNQLTEQQRQQINAEIFSGQKISAIKLYREALGGGLAEAKDAVERIEKDLRQCEPERFTHRAGKSGCLGVVAVCSLLVSAAAVTLYFLHS